MDGSSFTKKIEECDDLEELKKLKKWLFTENVRISAQKEELNALNQKLISERVQYQHEIDAMQLTLTRERQRLNQDSQFFSKKMEILQNGFMQLDADRRRFEEEKSRYYAEVQNVSADTSMFFVGVRSAAALKKRYRDLMKIFHPDNMNGDSRLVSTINREYEKLKEEY